MDGTSDHRAGDADLCPPFPLPNPAIPAKAGIQTTEANPATRNQVRIAVNKSLPLIILPRHSRKSGNPDD